MKSLNERARREKLFMTIGPHIKDWTSYGDVIDIVKKEAPNMYKWCEGHMRYFAPEVMADLDLVWLDFRWIKKTNHFRPNDYGPCCTAYKISDLGRIILRNQEEEKQLVRMGGGGDLIAIISPETLNSC
jgi:hypothetical protein